MNEVNFKRQFRTAVLRFLLEKYERSKAFREGEMPKQRPQFAMDGNNPFQADYRDEMDFFKKEWMHDVLQALQSEGVLALEWERFMEGRSLKKVYLQPETLHRTYELARVIPKDHQMKTLANVLERLCEHPWEWVQTWAEEKMDALTNKKSAGLQLDDLDSYHDLVEVLLSLPRLQTDIPKRVFSQQLFADTKHFEKHVQQRLTHLIRQYGPEALDSDEDALNYVGVVANPSFVLLAGHIHYTLDTRRRHEEPHTKEVSPHSLPKESSSSFPVYQTGHFRGGVGLKNATIEDMQIEHVVGKRIILIENMTSFEQWISAREASVYESYEELVIYTGGFPHRTLQHFLQVLSASLDEALPVFHWGDIDLGGIRIFDYLKQAYFPSLKPLFMDVHTLQTYKHSGSQLTKAYKQAIEKVLHSNRYPDWEPLLSTILAEDIRLEQECITTEDLVELHTFNNV